MTRHVDGARARSGSLASAAVLLLYIGIYLRDVLRIAISDVLPLLALGSGLLCAAIVITGRVMATGGRAGVATVPAYAVTAVLICWVFSALRIGTVPYSSYLFAVVFAFMIVHTNVNLFMRLVVGHFLVSLVIQLWEYQASTYLFTIVDENGVELDTELFAGSMGINRTKGLFPGPLSAVAFAFWIAFFHSRSVWAALGLVASAYLASGRLGMFVGLSLLAWRIISTHQNWKALAASAVLVSVAGANLLFGIDQQKLDFVILAFDPASGNNAGRLYYWAAAVSEYLNYGMQERLVGHLGYIRGTDVFPESDFLQILLDHGVLGLLIYILGIGRLVMLAMRCRDGQGLLVAFLLVAIMNVFPLAQSVFSGTLFWIYVFTYELRAKRNVTDNAPRLYGQLRSTAVAHE